MIAAHVALAPVWIILWTAIPLAIWLGDRGPVFYRQERAGRGGRVFTVRKFRTMVVDADRIGPVWTNENDPRITAVGRVLRKTALDELPQLLNIWRGDMSFIGPKPLAVEEQRQLEVRMPDFAKRLQVRPGLTGMAQVHNVGDAADQKLRYDLDYVEHMSLWLDISLVLLSIRNTLLGKWDTRGGKSDMNER